MKKILGAALAVLTMTFAGGDIAPVADISTADTSKDFYVGGGITAYTHYLDGEKDFFDDAEFSEISGGLEGKAGYTFYRDGAFGAAIEGQIGRSFWGMDLDSVDYVYNYGAYVKPSWDFTQTINGYALLGYARTGIEYDGDLDMTEDGFSYGIGANYKLDNTWSIYGEYVMLPSFKIEGIDDIDNDKITFGATYAF